MLRGLCEIDMQESKAVQGSREDIVPRNIYKARFFAFHVDEAPRVIGRKTVSWWGAAKQARRNLEKKKVESCGCRIA